MKILIVEDERKTAAFLWKGLTENGFTTDVVHQGDDGLHLSQTGTYDLIILDIMLPEKDGWSIVTQLRQAGKQTPILFLTARDAVEDKVKGLELGGDDYLVKPFAFSELLARAPLLCGAVRQPDRLQVSDLEIDVLRHKATRAGRRLDLTPKEFALLALRARCRRSAVTHAHCRAGLGHELR